MKIEIIEHQKVVKVIDVDLPYYYTRDMDMDEQDTIVYGKIEEHLHTSIEETRYYDDSKENFRISKTQHATIKYSGLSGYFQDKYASTEEEFQSAKSRCLLFLQEA